MILFAVLGLALQTQWAKTTYVPSQDVQLAVHEVGHGDPVLVLAGGPGLNPSIVKDLVDGIADHHKCLVLDQRGTGDSSLTSLSESKLQLSKYVDDIEAVRKAYKLPKVTIVGHSWGAMLSLVYAGQHPDQVEALTLVSCPPLNKNFPSWYSENIEVRLTPKEVADYQKAINDTGEANDSAELDALKAEWPAFFFDRRVAEKYRYLLKPGIVKSGIDTVVLPQYFGDLDGIANDLHRYHGPALIMQGLHDPIGQSSYYALRQDIAQAYIALIPRSARFPWLEQPASTLAVLNAWLDSPTGESLTKVNKKNGKN